LYEYMIEKLFKANLTADMDAIEEVQSLLKTVRESWAQIPSEVHEVRSSRSR